MSAVVAQNVRAARLSLGIGQQELATSAGILKSFVCHIERGRRLPRLDGLWRIAAALRVPASQLLEPPTPTHDTVASDLARHLNCIGHHVEEGRDVAGSVATIALSRDRIAVLPSHSRMLESSVDEFAGVVDTILDARWSALILLHGGRIDITGVGRAVNLWALASREKSLAGSYVVLTPNGDVRQDSNRKLRSLSTDRRLNAIPGA